jgi:hypothetical protein
MLCIVVPPSTAIHSGGSTTTTAASNSWWIQFASTRVCSRRALLTNNTAIVGSQWPIASATAIHNRKSIYDVTTTATTSHVGRANDANRATKCVNFFSKYRYL